MKKFRNEKGSVLVLIILVIAVLSVLGTSILAAAFSNYKMKITNSSLKENLYLSEAGLEETYAKVYKYVIEAIKMGQKEAKDEIAIFDGKKYEKEEDIKLLIENEEANGNMNPCIKLDSITDDAEERYKDAQYSDDNIKNVTYPFIIKYTIGSGADAVETYVYDTEWIANNPKEIERRVDEAFSTAFVTEFVKDIKDSNDGLVVPDTTTVISEITANAPTITAVIKEGDKLISKIEEDDFLPYLETKQLVLKLRSVFQNDLTKRDTEVDLAITVPKYNEPYAVTVTRKDIPEHPLWKQALATDGKINASMNTDVNGGVYSNTGIDVSSGFKVANGTTKVNDNTADTGNITVNGGNLELAGVSARNIFLNGAGVDYTGKGDMYIKDDFEMNNTGQKVNITGNYYGFEDGSTSEKGPDASSGIIINSDDIGTGSKFNLTGNVNINGVSYIKLSGGSYQTGESVSVKGNYLAYTMPFTGSKYNENEMTFEYKDPLMLPTKYKGNPLTVNDLKGYFMEYYEKYMDVYSPLNLSGITISGSVSTMGVSINNGQAIDGTGTNIINSNQDEIDKWKLAYEVATEYVGDNYLAGQPGGQITVNNDINFNVQLENNDGTKASAPYEEKLQYTDGSVNINLNGGSQSGFIISGGTVTISGSGTFRGCIIAKDGINIQDGLKAYIIYDENVVLKAFEKYKNLGDVFKRAGRNLKIKSYNSESIVKTDESGEGTNINYTSILDFMNWKINYD